MTVDVALRSLSGIVPKCLQLVLFIAVASLMEAEPLRSTELSDFIRVGRDFRAEPRWTPRTGKADVQIRGSEIEIRAHYRTDDEQTPPEAVDQPDVAITGTLGANGSVNAKCTFLNTDAIPVQLTGRYITRTETQIWGDRRKSVTYKEVVFPRPPNADFWGFVGRHVADQ